MTVDSIFKFQGAQNNAEMSFLRDNWELDDKEAETLHGLRKEAFFYMRDIAVNNNLRMTDTLNEESIDNFVRYSLDENLQRRQQWLESNRSLYANYAPFWLVLADTYYDLELYRECLDSVVRYEAVQAQIFRKEHDFAKILPKVIMAVSHVHGTSQTYLSLTKSYLEKLTAHTTDTDWALRYFAAQAYIRMAGISDRRANLTAAYNLLVDNVTYLSHVQEDLLVKYVAPIDETIPRGTPREKERQMKNMINGLKNNRKTEMPPIHSGLLSNLQVVHAIEDELKMTVSQRNRVRNIVRNTFITPQYRNLLFNEDYDFAVSSFSVNWGSTPLLIFTSIFLVYNPFGDNDWDGFILKIPAPLLSSETKINFSLITGENIFHDITDSIFEVKKVNRTRNQNINDFTTELAIPFFYVEDGKPASIRINKNQEYQLIVTLDNHGISCDLVFVKNDGRTDFSFVGIK